MCKCCQLCWEDLYWECIEEKYCYDKSIANYDPDEDEASEKNGHATFANGLDDNNPPITSQPTRLLRNISMNSTKIHENDVKREIQTANVNLAPEIVQVFAHSQIFHDHKPLKVKPTSPSSPAQHASFTLGSSSPRKAETEQINLEGSRKLLERLDEDKKPSTRANRVLQAPPRIIETPAINEEENEDDDDGVVLRPRHLQPANSSEEIWSGKLVNKNLKNLDAPYYAQRPASENDIFTISTPTKANVSSTSDANRFSMTPEVPSITFNNLPKNYLETPTVDKYKKEAPSLLEIQTAEIRKSMIDFSMPRYYGKSDLILNRSFDAVGSTTSIGSSGSVSSQSTKKQEKSKRLLNLRTNLPPLTILSKDKGEKEK